MATTLIIGGTAAYHLDFGAHATVTGERMIETPFGPAGPVLFFTVGGQECAFISRHGGQGSLGVTPPFINYHANVWTAREVGARRILSWNSVGAMVRSLEPGSLAVVADLIDWTRARSSSFGVHLIKNVLDGPLFAADLREQLYRAAVSTGLRVAPQVVYAGSEGARLETAAEIALLAAAGAEVVGMTMAPEAFLARELGLAYGSVCWVSNYATGVAFDGPERRLFGAEVGPLMFSIILKLLQEEAAAA
jgi:5'-methylthioadenosine phosphorylase